MRLRKQRDRVQLLSRRLDYSEERPAVHIFKRKKYSSGSAVDRDCVCSSSKTRFSDDGQRAIFSFVKNGYNSALGGNIEPAEFRIESQDVRIISNVVNC